MFQSGHFSSLLDILAQMRPLLWMMPFVLALAAVKLLAPRLRGVAGEAQVGRALGRLFPEVRHDLILPDGRGGLTQLDHVALTPAGLLVVETKNYRGTVLGQANEATWTQLMGRQRHSFQNPLRQNHAHIKAVQALGLGVAVSGRVVFTSAARFPKGLPDGVSRVSALSDDLADWARGEVPPAVLHAWKTLLGHARTDRAARQQHLNGLQARFGSDGRPRAAIALLALSAALAGGLWWSGGRSPTTRVQPLPSASITAHAKEILTDVMVEAIQPPASRSQLSPTPTPTPASIDWSDPTTRKGASEDCKLAITAVLIANTPENRQQRANVCGQGARP
ncbi:nuclease-related domain-containing protein [uncultured Thiocystis sp.]|jgi:hypothetical protein|uniref:nuclease-related domain-containing protein n=1 Tax=uncultured Thiocystis sp. TaxID=1202134 RepID=UPI0025DEF004|nr:nuclease-related domain-containing protein [uncultured Thiocystis sp.]